VTGRSYFLCTERLGFGTWAPDDFPLALALWTDPRVTGLFGGPFPVDEVRRRLDREITNQARFGFQYWPLFRLTDGAHVGCSGLRPCDRPHTREMGFHLRPEFWRQGFGTEAARAVVAHAFTSPDVEAIFAGHHPDNRDSRRLLTRLGFRSIGEELYPPTGLLHPSYLLDRSEWDVRREA